MNGLVLDLLLGLMAILDDDAPAVEVCVELLEATAH